MSLRVTTSRRILWILVNRAVLKPRVPHTQGAAVHREAQWLVLPYHWAPVDTGALWKVRKHCELCRSSPQLHRLGFAPGEAPAEHLTLHVDSDPAGLGQSLSPCTSNKPQGHRCCWTQGPHLLCLENPMSPRRSRGPLEFPPLQCRYRAQLPVLHGASTTARVLRPWYPDKHFSLSLQSGC